MKKELVNEKNKYLFYNDKNEILAFKQYLENEDRMEVIFPKDYLYTSIGIKKLEPLYKKFLDLYLWENEFIKKSISIDTLFEHKNGKLLRNYLRNIRYYYMAYREFSNMDWQVISSLAESYNLQAQMFPIDMLLDSTQREYKIIPSDVEAIYDISKRLVKESE